MQINITEEQLEVLLDDTARAYGYDFTGYTHASLMRRINRLIAMDGFPSFAEFRYKLNSDASYLKRFVEEITVNVTEMFRDASFFRKLRETVIPEIISKPFIRIWHAGCSTGEEVYSMAILLHEANVLHKSLIYATDINPEVVEKTKAGMFPLSMMREYSENYIASGGQADFSSYYTAGYDSALFKDFLRERMICSTHNLVSDGSFNEFQLVVCRNVLIYFDKGLQDRALNLFDTSLELLGFMALGSKETMRFSGVALNYTQLGKEKIWRKMK